MKKKILSIILAFSFVVQPAYTIDQPVHPPKKRLVTRAKEKLVSMKEAMSRGRAVLKANWQCLTTGKGEKCSPEKRLSLQIIRNFVKGNMKATKEGLGKLLAKHWTCWKGVLKGVGISLLAIPALLAVGVAGAAFAADPLVATSVLETTGKVVRIHQEQRAGKPKPQPKPEPVKPSEKKTFGQKLKTVGQCLLVIGLDIAIITALVFIIKTMDEKDVLRGGVLERTVRKAKRDLGGGGGLSMAVGFGDVRAVKEWIGDGVDVNERWGLRRETPLHRAAEKGYVEIAEILIRHGADKNLQNEDNKRPYELAKDQEFREILMPGVGELETDIEMMELESELK